MFKLPGRAGGRKLYPCPKEVEKLLPPNTCLWDASTNPIYRQPYEYYTFILNVENVLGNTSFQYKFHHYAHGLYLQFLGSVFQPAKIILVTEGIKNAFSYS